MYDHYPYSHRRHAPSGNPLPTGPSRSYGPSPSYRTESPYRSTSPYRQTPSTGPPSPNRPPRAYGPYEHARYWEPARRRDDYREPIRQYDGYRETARQQYDYREPSRQYYGYRETARSQNDPRKPAIRQDDYRETAYRQYDYCEPTRHYDGYREPAPRQYDYWEPAHRQYDYREPASRQIDYHETAHRPYDHREPTRRQDDYRETNRRQDGYYEPVRPFGDNDWESARQQRDYQQARYQSNHHSLSRGAQPPPPPPIRRPPPSRTLPRNGQSYENDKRRERSSSPVDMVAFARWVASNIEAEETAERSQADLPQGHAQHRAGTIAVPFAPRTGNMRDRAARIYGSIKAELNELLSSEYDRDTEQGFLPLGFGSGWNDSTPGYISPRKYGATYGCHLGLCKDMFMGKPCNDAECKHVHRWPSSEKFAYLLRSPDERARKEVRSFISASYPAWFSAWQHMGFPEFTDPDPPEPPLPARLGFGRVHQT